MSEMRVGSGQGGRVEPMIVSPARPSTIQVWDLPVRVVHWGLAVAVLVAWICARYDAGLHAWVGMVAAGLIGFRIFWGFAGPWFARFDDMMHPPGRIIRHMRDVGGFRARRYLGHDPSGGFLALVMLILLAVICSSGLVAHSDPSDPEVAWVRDVHKWSSNILLALLPFHILAVMIKGWLHRESLTLAMVTGWKKLGPEDELPEQLGRPELRLADRLRATEALALWGLLALLAAWIVWPQLATTPRVAEQRSLPVPAVVQPAAAPAPAVASTPVTVQPATIPAPAPAPAAPASTLPVPTQAEADLKREREALLGDIQKARDDAMRLLSGERERAEREFNARLLAAKQEADREMAARVREAREQAVQEYQRLAAANQQRPATEPARPAVAAAPTGEPQRRPRDLISEAGSPDGMLSSGGRIYDNWYAALGKSPPTSNHPAWPSGASAPSPAATWRCTSCHGYDYRGAVAGANGVRGAERRDPERIVAALGDQRHGFTDEMLPPIAKIRLALFLSRGQYTAARYFDPNTKRAKGTASRGKDLYLQACAACHGLNGRAIATQAGGSGLGELASREPANVFHRVRNGHPGAEMSALRPYPLSSQTDVLAYIQSLPQQ